VTGNLSYPSVSKRNRVSEHSACAGAVSSNLRASPARYLQHVSSKSYCKRYPVCRRAR
jgi:hypothetical protein